MGTSRAHKFAVRLLIPTCRRQGFSSLTVALTAVTTAWVAAATVGQTDWAAEAADAAAEAAALAAAVALEELLAAVTQYKWCRPRKGHSRLRVEHVTKLSKTVIAMQPISSKCMCFPDKIACCSSGAGSSVDLSDTC